MALKGSLIHPPLAGDFYQIFPHSLLAWMFGSVFVLAIGLLMAGVIRFWRKISPGVPRSAEIAEASHNALTLKYLDGGHGKGCNEADDAFTLLRRRFHHFTFYGFMLCFAATVVATGYHYVAGWEAPYPFLACRSCSARWAVSVCLSARPGYCGSICGGRRYMAMRARNPWIAALFCCCS
ncbi:tricarballylate utilization protein B [Salmonella enterica subsp. enterica serovar Heidelberg str. 75-3547]|nr:tricarballylate utilization protein B [Salmonella enterica subsp. enterica serovar Heidelberg str. 75-3547]